MRYILGVGLHYRSAAEEDNEKAKERYANS
jgi:hypothetical protein